MINQFYINNFKCLVDVRVPLTPIHVIIGQNDSGKTSLLEAMLALYQSTERSLADAFAGDWQGRELVFAGEEKPVVQFEVRFDAAEGKIRSPMTYHLEVEFGRERLCRRIDEWFENTERIPIAETCLPGGAGLARRSDLKPDTLRDHVRIRSPSGLGRVLSVGV